jgi:8-oxo-dGTP diphosphatase
MANDPLKTIIVVKAMLLNAEGEVLVLRRSATHPTLAHKPDLPGGQVDGDEELSVALIREIAQETGVTITAADLKLLYAGTESWHGENRIRLFYVARLKTERPEIVLSWEHSEYAWLLADAVAEIEKEYHGFYREALAYIRTNNLLETV